MDITEWYSIALGSLAALAIIACLLLAIIKLAHIYASLFFLKHVLYPQIHRYLRGPAKTTRFDVILILAFLVGNVFCMTIGLGDTSDLATRSALMSVINLIPLSLGARMNLIASRCGIGHDVYSRIHRWLGRAAAAEGLIHAVAATSIRDLDLHAQRDIAALVSALTTVAFLMLSLLWVRRQFHEIFSKLHFLLGVTLVVAIYLHIPTQQLWEPPSVYLFSGICVQVFVYLLRYGVVIYRNLRYRRPISRATIRPIVYTKPDGRDTPISDAVHVHVKLPRPWKPRAGQYVYLCVPGASRSSFAQSHPFYASWWYQDEDGYVLVLIVQKRSGFTRNLFLHANDEMKALVDGPYGKELDLASYGTVLLFATGIGIAGQLPYVTRILEGYHNSEVKTRRIALLWQLDSEFHTAWVADMMMELLRRDTKKVDPRHPTLRYGELRLWTDDAGRYGLSGERISVTYEAMEAESLIRSEIKDRRGHTVVSMCVNDTMSDQIRESVRRMLDTGIHLKELDFRPYSPGPKRGIRTMIGGSKKAGIV